jgi:23S rRNA pseudouridine955/2504/2580 synthase
MLKYIFKDTIVPKLIHRIDKDTSGLLLVAKDQQAAKKFSNYFKERKIIKTYLAIVSPCPKNDQGIIDLPIYKGGPKGHQKMIVDYNRGKKAITEYKILDKVSSRAGLMALYPKTGRTHQLRVHLEYLNSPIVGDKKYSGLSGVCSLDDSLLEHESISKIKWSNESIKNLQLHAYSIRMPSDELIEAEISDNFKKNLNFLGLIIPKNIHKLFI